MGDGQREVFHGERRERVVRVLEKSHGFQSSLSRGRRLRGCDPNSTHIPDKQYQITAEAIQQTKDSGTYKLRPWYSNNYRSSFIFLLDALMAVYPYPLLSLAPACITCKHGIFYLYTMRVIRDLYKAFFKCHYFTWESIIIWYLIVKMLKGSVIYFTFNSEKFNCNYDVKQGSSKKNTDNSRLPNLIE